MAILKNTSINDTGAIQIASGSTAERPAANDGLLRYNTFTKTLEFSISNGWTSLVQIGSVELFASISFATAGGAGAPQGWLRCNGAAISRTTYSNLFSVIGTSFGVGDGSTTFNVPDFRGIFPRSWDDGRGVDTGRALSSTQQQDWKSFHQTNTLQNVSSGFSHGPVYMGKTIFGSFTGNLFTGRYANPSASWGTAWDTSEIRPRNNVLLACIKY
jgi:phage-related tail fiber protein